MQLEDVLSKSDENPGTAVMDKIKEENAAKPKAPKKKASLKDGPKRTISVQLPPEVRPRALFPSRRAEDKK